MSVTAQQQNYLRRGFQISGGVIDLTVTPVGGAPGQIAAGDLLYLTAAKQIASLNTPGTSNANTASFFGVSIDTYPLQIGYGISESAAQNETPSIAFRLDGEFLFFTTAGDTYNPGDVVYLGADGQTISKTASGTAIGRIPLDLAGSPSYVQGNPVSTPVVGGVGVQVPVRINPAIVL